MAKPKPPHPTFTLAYSFRHQFLFTTNKVTGSQLKYIYIVLHDTKYIILAFFLVFLIHLARY